MSQSPSRLAAYLGVARAPFLLLPVVLIASGTAAAAYDGAFSWANTSLALIGLILLHVAVNVLNEVSDYRSGIDFQTQRTPFSGGSGTLPGDRLGVRTAAAFGITCLLAGLAIGVLFIIEIGFPVVWLVIAAAIIIALYTAVLLKIGLGEVAAGLGLGALPVIGAGLVQGGEVMPAVWVLTVPAWCMTFNLLLLNEFPDEVADRAGGRKHLVILLGRRGAALVYVVVSVISLMSIASTVFVGWWPMWALLGLFGGIAVIPAARWAISTPTEGVPIPALAGNVMWNLSTHALLALGFVISMVFNTA